MLIVLVIFIFALMVFIPFGIALKELYYPKDDKPLYIDMMHSKDPLYFGKAFKKIVKENIENKIIIHGTQRIRLSKDEVVEVGGARNVPADSKWENIFYITEDFTTGNRTILRKDIYVKGGSVIGPNNVLRAIYGEQDIYLNEKCRVTRWISSEQDMFVSSGSHLGRSTASLQSLMLMPGVQFESMYGLPIMTMDSSGKGKTECLKLAAQLKNFIYPPRIPVRKVTSWRIVKQHISVNCEDGNRFRDEDDKSPLASKATDGDKKCFCEKAGFAPCNDNIWEVYKDRVVLPEGSRVQTNFVSRKELIIKKNCVVEGNVKSYKDLIIESGTIIHGDVFCEGDIYIRKNTVLGGNVFSQSRIFVGNNVRISFPGHVKSVIGKKRIEIDKNSVIYGYILAEGKGLTPW